MRSWGTWSAGLGLLAIAIYALSLPEDGPSRKVAKLPSDWHWIQRTYPHYDADPSAFRLAIESRNAMMRAGKTTTEPWEFEGPTNIGGRISDLEFNPKAPDIVYAAAATGGVMKSTDGGLAWTPVFDDQAILTIGDIGIDPSSPETLYVGTGEANGGHNNFPGGGLYKSVNGGMTWSFSGLDSTASIGRVIVDPSNSDRVFVAAAGSYFRPNPQRGVYRTDDGGATWDLVLAVDDSTGAIDLVMRPDNPDVLLAAMWTRVRREEGAVQLYGHGSGIYRSNDGGDSWTLLGPSNGLPDPVDHQDFSGVPRIGRIGLSLCLTQPDVMYALINNGSGYLGLYRTADGGDTWTVADAQRRLSTIGPSGNFTFSWYFGQVRVDPNDPDLVYVLDVGLMTSDDGGLNWSSTTGTHVDYHAMAFHPTDQSMILNGNDGGISRLAPHGEGWTSVPGLPITQFYEIAFDPSAPERLYGGTQDNGTIRTTTGALDDWQRILGGDGFYVIVDPDDPNVVYAESQFGALARSTNGGSSFASARNGISSAEKSNWSTPVVMDPNNHLVLYYGTSRLYRTVDQASTWQAVSGSLVRSSPSARLGTITTIAVAPSDSNVVYVGTDDGLVWVTQDYGASWTDVTSGLPNRWVTRVAVHPAEASVAYVTFSGLKWRDPQPHIFRTADFGNTWSDVSGNLPDAPINAIAIYPNQPDVLFVGTDVGVFSSSDEGASWIVLGAGLPTVSVYDLKIIAAEQRLVAGTHGRSMYSIDIHPLITGIELPPDVTASLEAWPNPFRESVTITTATAVSEPAEIRIYDVSGRLVRTLDAAGGGVTWDGTAQDGGAVPSGVYFARRSGPANAEYREPALKITLVR